MNTSRGRTAVAGACASALTALLAGCTVTVGGGTPAAPAASRSPSPSWYVVKQPTPPREIGPEGLAGLDVGMTIDEAVATGQFERPDTIPPACDSATGLNGITVGYSRALGITSLTAENLHTPEGIHTGSTFDDVVRAYPHPADPVPAGTDARSAYLDDLTLFGAVWASVPGRKDASYIFMFDRRGLTRATADRATVGIIRLKLKADVDCG